MALSDLTNFISNAVEDLVSLEVATLTNKGGEPMNLNPTLNAAQQANLNTAQTNLDDARNALISAITTPVAEGQNESTKKQAIKTAKSVKNQRETELKELQSAMGIYNPKDIFSYIRSNLKTADLVAYSRFEIEGDSVNFVSNSESNQSLVSAHKDMVAAAQESRKNLFQTAKSFL